MDHRTTPNPSWVLLGCLAWNAVAVPATLVLERGNGASTANTLDTPENVAFVLLSLAPLVAGALMLRRAGPRTAAWLLVASTTVMSTGLLLHALAVDQLRHGSDATLLVWAALWTVGPGFALLALVPHRLLREHGRPRWEWLPITAIAVIAMCQAFGPAPLTGVGPAVGTVANPFAVPALEAWAGPAVTAASLVLVVYALTGLVAMLWHAHVVRRRMPRAPRPWPLLAAVLLPALALGAVAGWASGAGGFAGAWWAAVLVPLVLLAGTVLALLRGWVTERRTTRMLRTEADIRERERERIRLDLHDGIGPALAGMRLQLDALVDHLPEDAVASRHAATHLGTALEETFTELRRIIDGLDPLTLDHLGLAGAIEHIAALTAPLHARGTDVRIDVQPDLPDLPRTVESVLLKVCAEAVSNAVRHGSPTCCRVSLDLGRGVARLRVSDNGTGMPVDGVAVGAGLGLHSMRTRVEAIGGTLRVGSSPTGPGTEVVAVVPVAG